MKRKCVVGTTLFLIVLGVAFISCGNENNADDKFVVDNTNIAIPSAGGDCKIQMNTADWSIVNIVNEKGNSAIKGSIRVGDPEVVYKDTLLSLEQDFGSLTAQLDNNGFTIKRYTGKTLQLAVDENKSSDPFVFDITLKSGNAVQTIKVEQKASER
jgi:hypothetical protein